MGLCLADMGRTMGVASMGGVVQDMVMRRGRAVGAVLCKCGHGGKQSYLGFRMLARPLVEEEASDRGVGWDMVARRGEKIGVILDSHTKDEGGLNWGSGC